MTSPNPQEIALPPEREIVDTIDEIERCLWRSMDASSKKERNDHLEEMDSEITSLLLGSSEPNRLNLVDRILRHLENLPGMDAEIIEEVFEPAHVLRQDVDVYRLSSATPVATLPVSTRRI